MEVRCVGLAFYLFFFGGMVVGHNTILVILVVVSNKYCSIGTNISSLNGNF